MATKRKGIKLEGPDGSTDQASAPSGTPSLPWPLKQAANEQAAGPVAKKSKTIAAKKLAKRKAAIKKKPPAKKKTAAVKNATKKRVVRRKP